MCTPRPKTKVTLPSILEKKTRGEAITVLTAYDFQTASVLDRCGVDILLVGDSLGNVVYGFENTLPVTMDMMVNHSAAVARGRKNAFVVTDLPFMSYQVSEEEAVRNAGRLIKEGQAEAVKLEGGKAFAGHIRKICTADIPLMGHIGLRPQAVHMMGGYKMQGTNETAVQELIEDAQAIEEAGAFAIVIEGVPAELAEKITSKVSIPTIGIGAGPGCSGQVLVINDMLGLSEYTPKFVRRFADISTDMENAARAYIEAVKTGTFPSEKESFSSGKKP